MSFIQSTLVGRARPFREHQGNGLNYFTDPVSKHGDEYKSFSHLLHPAKLQNLSRDDRVVRAVFMQRKRQAKMFLDLKNQQLTLSRKKERKKLSEIDRMKLFYLKERTKAHESTGWTIEGAQFCQKY
ncbi:hypothetical protein BaRGS_00006712 [Batillaria attramentaria]|uniref:Uncharacterized protein n=1 Tax=Batillaria attramentaria TaxID=370345 RepID=A0ABD0LRQ9_9CAEN